MQSASAGIRSKSKQTSHLPVNIQFSILGIPLEMSQPGWIGSGRVAIVYIVGVAFACLSASVIQPTRALVGASGGVYAILWAHLATIILNWKEDGIMYQKRKEEGAPPPLNYNNFIRITR